MVPFPSFDFKDVAGEKAASIWTSLSGVAFEGRVDMHFGWCIREPDSGWRVRSYRWYIPFLVSRSCRLRNLNGLCIVGKVVRVHSVHVMFIKTPQRFQPGRIGDCTLQTGKSGSLR